MSKRSRRRRISADLTGTAKGALIDRVTELDRQWFEQHPGETQYLRPRVPGEFATVDDEDIDGDAVLVQAIAPGIRSRTPVYRTTADDPNIYKVIPPAQQWKSAER